MKYRFFSISFSFFFVDVKHIPKLIGRCKSLIMLRRLIEKPHAFKQNVQVIPLFISLLLKELIWIIVAYHTESLNNSYSIHAIMIYIPNLM